MKKTLVLPVLFRSLGCLVVLASAGWAQTYTSGDWTYTFNANNEAAITGYVGTGGSVVIPSSVGGYLVKTLRGRGEPIFGRNNTSVVSVTISDGVTTIGDAAFAYCTSLIDVAIPESVTSIGYGAFAGCSSLTSISIPASVTSIESGAFAGCSSLTSISIPASVTSIDRNPFRDCGAIINFEVSPTNPNYASIDGIIFSKSLDTLVAYPGARTGPYTIPNSVTSIASDAFRGSVGLTSVSIHGNVARVDGFSGCKNLVGVSMAEGVTTIGGGAFEGCSSLDSPTIPNSVNRIEPFAFASCSSLTQVTLPQNLVEWDNYAFAGCTNLQRVIIPEGITQIGPFAFYKCESLNNVVVPRSVEVIYDEAFADCASLSNILFLGGAPVTGDNRFSGAPATVYYEEGSFGWSLTFAGRPTQSMTPSEIVELLMQWDADGVVLQPKLIVQNFGGAPMLSDAPPIDFVTPVGSVSESAIFTIRNAGTQDLTDISIESSGPGSDAFSSSSGAGATLTPGEVSSLQVSFSPDIGGNKTATISITSNDTNNSPFIINLSGTGLGEDSDTDGDGLNDAAEFTLSALGYNWEVAQNDLVASLYNNAHRAELFSEEQYNTNRTNGQTDVTTNPSAFNLFTAEEYAANYSNGVNAVLSTPSNYNLYTSSSIMDLHMGGLMVQKSGTHAIVSFQPQTTTDLTQPFTNNGTPITNTIPMPGNKGFIRINAKP